MNWETLKCLAVHKTQEGQQDQCVEVTPDQAVGMALSKSLVSIGRLDSLSKWYNPYRQYSTDTAPVYTEGNTSNIALLMLRERRRGM